MIRANPNIAAMAAYPLADLPTGTDTPPISLAQNESFRPPSPSCAQAVAEAAHGAALYPDPDWTALRQAIAAVHDVPVEEILCGAGSLDLIAAIAQVYSGPGRAVLAPAHAYPFFKTASAMAGARFDIAEEVDGTVSVDALLRAVKPDTALVFVANPANPTGTRIATGELTRLRAGLPGHVLLVIDEAYGEFADGEDAPTWPMVALGNTIVTRSFSKAYGLAGARVGWGLFPSAIAAEVRKVLNPNAIPATSQAAATAAMSDQAYMRETCAETAKLRARATERLRDAGFIVTPSFTNFILIRFETPEDALAADVALKGSGFILRHQAGAGLPDALRLTLGTQTDTDAAIDALIAWRAERSTPA